MMERLRSKSGSDSSQLLRKCNMKGLRPGTSVSHAEGMDGIKLLVCDGHANQSIFCRAGSSGHCIVGLQGGQ